MLIVCNGMMRAGSTLQYNLVRSLIEKTHLGQGHGFFLLDQSNNIEEQFDLWAQDTNYHVIKMHEMYPKSIEMIETELFKICYIYRDIRDVAFSLKRKFGYKSDNLIKTLDDAILIYYKMETTKSVLCQKYEDVIRDLHTSIRTLAVSLGVEPSKDLISLIAKEWSLKSVIKKTKYISMRFAVKKLHNKLKSRFHKSGGSALEQEGTSILNQHDQRTLLHPAHISRDSGAVGAWRNGLNKEEGDLITERYESWLIDTGYIE